MQLFLRARLLLRMLVLLRMRVLVQILLRARLVVLQRSLRLSLVVQLRSLKRNSRCHLGRLQRGLQWPQMQALVQNVPDDELLLYGGLLLVHLADIQCHSSCYRDILFIVSVSAQTL